MNPDIAERRPDVGEFELDTSGAAALPYTSSADQTFVSTLWTDLTPFEQGYVRALFASAHNALQAERQRRFDKFMHSEVATCPTGERFSDLSPEALAMIRRDCDRMGGHLNRLLDVKYGRETIAHRLMRFGVNEGRMFWTQRQAGKWRDHKFPPVTISRADDGKVYLR